MGLGVGQISLLPSYSADKELGLSFYNGFAFPIYSKTDP